MFLTVFVAMQGFVDVNRVVGNEPPVIILNVSSYVIDEGETLTLDVSDSYDPEGKSLYFTWKFGTDTSWRIWSSTLTYSMVMYDSTKNPITIMAKVSDSLLEASTQTSITVNNLPPVVEACPDIVAYNGTEVSFYGTYSDPGNDHITLRKWDFGDGESIETINVNVKHFYELPGEYTATLTVEDEEGASASDTVAVSIVETHSTPIILQLCDSEGNPRDFWSTYDDGDSVFVKGSGPPNLELPFYVVRSIQSWEDGILLSELTWVSGTLITIDSQGNIPVTKVCDRNVPNGDYAIFVDVNNNEVYDEDIDIVFERMMSKIPEGQYGALATILILAVFAIVLIKQKKYLKSKSLGRDDVA